MITHLAEAAQRKSGAPFFYVQTNGRSLCFSFRRARLCAAALARELERRGVVPGSTIACNLYNGAEIVFLSLAAAYGGFTLALLNPRLSDDERRVRLVELENATGEAGMGVLDAPTVDRLFIDATGYDITRLSDQPEGAEALASLTLSLQEYAHARESAFDAGASGVVMFTSGSSGTPKATLLSWRCLAGAAAAANDALAIEGRGVWQMVLPMCHVGGFQIMVRSALNASTFVVYEHYNPSRILNDVLSLNATHISVVDKVLCDLLDQDHDRIINRYACILLGGSALNDKTIRRAQRARANVYSSYGMTETASLIAAAPVTRNFDGALHVLSGYDVRIMRPDAEGIGQLRVSGPGVFEGYLNARKAQTEDGYFVTGDRARIDARGLLHVYERTEDLIISGGENIYPAEVRDVLCKIPGVKDAYVFGTADETWGYRPVAFVEADYSPAAIAADHQTMGLDPAKTGIRAATCPQEFAHLIHDYLEPRMSHLHHPKHILVTGEFPRGSTGKVDYRALKQRYDARIDIKQVRLLRTRQPFAHPVRTSQGTIDARESFFVEVEDWAGRTGIAEGVAFSTDWYLPETIDADYALVRDRIARVVLEERYLHPSEVSASFATFPDLAAYPLAKAAVEPAVWDLYGKITGQPLAKLIGAGPEKKVLGGAVVGIGTPEETVARVAGAVGEGYTRVKLKVEPETALACVSAVREAYPDLIIMLDANQSFDESHLDVLTKLDALGLACVEEPYNPAYTPLSGEKSLFERLSELQRHLKAPVCLDESVVSARDMREAMRHDDLRCYSIKIAKFGGVQPALDFIDWAQGAGKQVWMGGMFDTGVSKRLHAAFCALPGMAFPGDVSSYSAYFTHDSATPPLELEGGELLLNDEDHPAGLGCTLDKEYLRSIATDEVIVTKEA